MFSWRWVNIFRLCALFLVALLTPLAIITCGSSSSKELSASVSQRIHPVLIRNDRNPLLQLVIKVKREENIRLRSISFSLEGTDDLADLESLELFYAGEDQELLIAGTGFGQPAQPATKISFQGNQVLRSGTHVFWLSCRLRSKANLSHKVDAACTNIDTTLGKITPKDESPGVRKRIGFALRKPNDDSVHTYRIPALTTTIKGTLLSVYDVRRRSSRDLQEDIDIGLSRSTDGGQTWESPRIIMDMGEYGGFPQEQNGVSDPGIIVDRETGEIFCFATWMLGKPGKHQWTEDGSEPGYEIGKSAQFMMVRSKDDGQTWTEPENMTRELKREEWWLLAPSPQQGINLDDGTLVMPTQGRDENGVSFSNLMISRDHGLTWTISSPAYSGGSESQAVQLSNGSIMLNMRNQHQPYRAVFITHDIGQTWHPHKTNINTLIEPNCNGSLYRFDYENEGEKKQLLLFSNPHSQQTRTHQTIQVSLDQGLTWPKKFHLLLDEGLGKGYPSITKIDNQHIGIVYEGSQSTSRDKERINSRPNSILAFEKITLDELLKR